MTMVLRIAFVMASASQGPLVVEHIRTAWQQLSGGSVSHEIQDRICAVSTLVMMLSVYKDAEILNEAERIVGQRVEGQPESAPTQKHAALGCCRRRDHGIPPARRYGPRWFVLRSAGDARERRRDGAVGEAVRRYVVFASASLNYGCGSRDGGGGGAVRGPLRHGVCGGSFGMALFDWRWPACWKCDDTGAVKGPGGLDACPVCAFAAEINYRRRGNIRQMQATKPRRRRRDKPIGKAA